MRETRNAGTKSNYFKNCSLEVCFIRLTRIGKSGMNTIFALPVFDFSSIRGYGRVWTTVEGKTQDGELLKFDGNEVGIIIKGREYRFLINRFIPSDRRYIRDWSKAARCHRCAKQLGNAPFKEAGSYKFHELVLNVWSVIRL